MFEAKQQSLVEVDRCANIGDIREASMDIEEQHFEEEVGCLTQNQLNLTLDKSSKSEEDEIKHNGLLLEAPRSLNYRCRDSQFGRGQG